MTSYQLYSKILALPDPLKSEVNDFVDFLDEKKKQKPSSKPKRVFGYAKDSVIIKPGFDDPLDDFKDYM